MVIEDAAHRFLARCGGASSARAQLAGPNLRKRRSNGAALLVNDISCSPLAAQIPFADLRRAPAQGATRPLSSIGARAAHPSSLLRSWRGQLPRYGFERLLPRRMNPASSGLSFGLRRPRPEAAPPRVWNWCDKLARNSGLSRFFKSSAQPSPTATRCAFPFSKTARSFRLRPASLPWRIFRRRGAALIITATRLWFIFYGDLASFTGRNQRGRGAGARQEPTSFNPRPGRVTRPISAGRPFALADREAPLADKLWSKIFPPAGAL